MKKNFPPYDEVVKFHGHSCPGLATGYKLTTLAFEKLNELRSQDEEIVAIVENDACGTDAVQYISGCTFGKGNFIFKDHGKMVYTFICRKSGKAVRASRNPVFRKKVGNLTRDEMINAILSASAQEFVKLEETSGKVPVKAQLYKNLTCEECQETVMETRIKEINGRKLCIPCANKEISS
ncbi:MAG: TraR/DksA C4-type zinc finger protein [Candidatus Cloacimonetes bacterium]|nr:TraR/DksA C4-type zinc finger protein [Candidatus Cloacimonadota bacterium]